jgi:hypothetical protein
LASILFVNVETKRSIPSVEAPSFLLNTTTATENPLHTTTPAQNRLLDANLAVADPLSGRPESGRSHGSGPLLNRRHAALLLPGADGHSWDAMGIYGGQRETKEELWFEQESDRKP